MLGIALSLLGKGGGWIKYALIAAAIAGAFFYVRNMGVQSERARWNQAILIEQGRQESINEQMVLLSTADADDISLQRQRLALLREEAEREANSESNADDSCLSASGVMRLNAIR